MKLIIKLPRSWMTTMKSMSLTPSINPLFPFLVSLSFFILLHPFLYIYFFISIYIFLYLLLLLCIFIIILLIVFAILFACLLIMKTEAPAEIKGDWQHLTKKIKQLIITHVDYYNLSHFSTWDSLSLFPDIIEIIKLLKMHSFLSLSHMVARYIFLLRDRIIAFPLSLPSILPSCISVLELVLVILFLSFLGFFSSFFCFSFFLYLFLILSLDFFLLFFFLSFIYVE